MRRAPATRRPAPLQHDVGARGAPTEVAESVVLRVAYEDAASELLSRDEADPDPTGLAGALDLLRAEERTTLELHYGLARPRDYRGDWPASLTDVGVYLGRRRGTRSLTRRTMRRLHVAALRRCRELLRS